MINNDAKKTILLVEDEAIISIVISKTLKRFGYNVLTAGSGEKAVELSLSNDAIDLVLMDIDLGSGIDGTETAKQILAFREIPIVFHTSHSEREMVDRVRGITRYGYVIKSSGDFVLQSSIEMAFELVEAHKKIKASEEHFYAMFERAPLGYQSLDVNGCFLEVNQKWLETLGYSKEEVAGRWFGDFLAPEYVEAFRERFPIFKAQGKIHSEFQMMHKNGSRRYIAFEGRVGYQEDGSFKQTHCILSDDTERKKAEDALIESEAFIKTVMDSLPIGIAVNSVNPEVKFSYMNDNFPRFYRTTREAVSDPDSFWSAVYEDAETREYIKKMVLADCASGSPERMHWEDIPITRRDMDTAYITAMNVPLNDKELMISLVWDVTERNLVQREIKSKNEELASLNEELNATIEEMEVTNEELTAAMEEMEATNEELISTNERLIESEKEVEISESLFRGLFNSMTSGSAIYTVINDGSRGADYIVKSFNEASLKMEGKTLEDVVGKSLFDLRPEIDNYGLISILKKVWDTGEPAFFPVKIYQDDHFSNYYDNYVFKIPSGEVVTIYNDVTDRKKAEFDLRESQNNLARIIENSSELICEIDEAGRYTFVSKRFEDILGYTPDELLGQLAKDQLHPDDLAAAIAKHETVKSEKGTSVDEWRFRHKNGSYHTFQCRGSVYIDGNGSPKTVVVAHDITESKQIEDTQRFLIMSGSHLSGGDDFFQSLARYLAETLKMDFVCIDKLVGTGLSARTVAVYFDGEFEDNIVYTLNDTPCGVVAGKTICTFEENVQGLFPEDLVLQEMKAESYAGVTLWGSNGEPIGLIAVIGREKMENPVLVESILKMVAIRAAGELERRDAEEKIKNLLLEKELLLKEVHHRIKNNMNTINGLLSLQSESLKDPAAVDALKDAESRVQSMMVLYDKLYRSDNFNEVSISEYLPGLITEITENSHNKKNIHIESRIDDFILGVQTLVPIGIIVNELITNTMKYAFTGRDGGSIKISAELKNGKTVLTIEDDGVGIPETVTFENSSGFGMQLVAMLTEQINGNIRIERDNGTRFVLEFEV